NPSELILGSARNQGPNGYRLEVQLEQKGAGVGSLASSRYSADNEGHRIASRPLQLLKYDPPAPPTLATSPNEEHAAKPATDDEAQIDLGEEPLAETVWDVVRDKQGRAVRPITKVNPGAKGEVEGQEVVFRTTVDSPPVVLTKTFRLWKGEDSFDLE